MAITTDPTETTAPAPDDPDPQRSVRRMLRVLLIILGIAAVALLAVLLWLLRPEDAGPPPDQAAGYPIEVVTTIYGYGSAESEVLTKPLGTTFDGEGNVWISNTGLSRVEVYTSDGDYIRTVGDEEGDGRLYSPYGLTVDDDRDLVYVADLQGQRIQIYTPEGEYAGHLPADDERQKAFGPEGFAPYDVEVSPDGRIVVASYDGLYFFDQDGHVVARWGKTVDGRKLSGPGEGMFNFPDSFVIDPETGWTYVTDTGNRRVIAIDQDGFWKWVSGLPDDNDKIRSFWQLPRSIELGSDGNLFVVDTFRFDDDGMGTGHLVVLDKRGNLLSEFGRSGGVDGAFSYPDQLALGPEGLWAIADRENDRVVIFRLIPPYPEVDDPLADRYGEGFSRPENVWVTPPPLPESIADADG